MDYLLPPLPEIVRQAEDAGNFRLARRLIKGLLRGPLAPGMAGRLRYEPERLGRIKKAHPYDRKAALKVLKDRLKGVKPGELTAWINSGLISPKVIDGRELFFSSFASNLLFLAPKLRKRLRKEDNSVIGARDARNKRLDELIRGAAPARYRVRARITLELKKPPKGKVRCWLPFPRVADQVSAARLLAASHKKYRLAGPQASQRTIYFEERASKFFAEFEYAISETILNPPPLRGRNYIPPSVTKYLKEEPPHIVFTPYVKALAGKIIGKEKDNYRKAQKIYDWLTLNLNYTFVMPYGIIENISEYCLSGLRGDCGVQAIAFITLCRAAGVPAKWQSGWNVSPGIASPHDWAMFYCGGWRFADISVGNARRANEKRRRFYFGSLDAWRMPANSEFGAALWPAKKHWRTDPTDNQMGEAETAFRNLYSDEFKYKIELIGFSGGRW